MELSSYLEQLVNQQGSDLFLSVNAPVCIKSEGVIKPLDDKRLTAPQVYELTHSVLTDEQISTFESCSELNIALRIKGIGRFRLNLFRQMGDIALVARYIQAEIPSLESLGLPALLEDLIMLPRGLILMVGGTGTGKSTSLAAMIDHRNSHSSSHILTIEDPVEFVHEHKKSLVNQREVGIDTASFEVALKNAMREAPDVILIGEIRDRETMKSALAYAETGHLCISTLHANNANQAIDRILGFYPDDAHKQVLQDLSLNLRAVISQRLPIGINGKRIAAIEVMLDTPYIKDLIAKGHVDKLKEAITQSSEVGCKTFDDALYDLVDQKKITEIEALNHADSKNNLSLRFRLEGSNKTTTLRKNVSYDELANFSEYETYRLRKVKVAEENFHKVEILEEAFRAALTSKGMLETAKDPDLEIQYILVSKARETKALNGVDNPVNAQISLADEQKKHGILRVNILDLHSNKVVWQVTATREMMQKPRAQEEVNQDADYLFEEFPPFATLSV
ncbi:MAG: PilT/PilU family type 4a pilus ATPase [Pseudomonadales bacterium]|nr:PilT/PilU family type 4a pilus ATPase [Pseudomonadales bacterium]